MFSIFFKKIYLFEREKSRESTSRARGRGKGRSGLPTEQGS